MTEPTRLPKRLRTRDADQRRTDADTPPPPVPARWDERYDPSPYPIDRRTR